MKCHEAREFFSPYLDGELSQAELNIFEQHLSWCPACREELSRWQELSRALQGLKTPVVAPPGFLAAANARLAARQKVRPWQGIRRWVAAAAAVAVLAAGSISYAARGLWQQLPILATNPPGQQVAVDNPSTGVNLPPVNEPATPANPDPGNNNSPPGSEPGQPGTAPLSGGNSSTSPDPSRQESNLPPGSDRPEQQPVQVAGSETYTARAFLSDGRQTSSTLLKLAVADLAEAKVKVTNLAANNGATVQVIDDRNNGQENRLIYQFTVANEKAGALLVDLSKAGKVTAQNVNTQDLTQQFNSTLEQYQAKVAQANSAGDPDEKARLLEEAKTLEQQLLTWEQESKQQTIVLWLEVK